jgi:translation initiation factor IF-3
VLTLISWPLHIRTGKWDGICRFPHPAAPPAGTGGTEPGFVVTAAPAVDRWRTSRVRHFRVPRRFPSGRSAAADPVQQRDQRGDHIATDDARINDRIRAREVLLIGAGGEQLGVKPLPEALAIAREEELDLVEVAPNANPPVCRIMNYGRYKYEQEQRRKESRKKATNVVVKEMKFRPKIDEHDYVTKMKHVERFLAEGSKVKLTIMFRGREVFHPELGLRILERVAEQVRDIAMVESAPRQDGRNMTMVLHPTKRPARARAGATPPPGGGNGSEGEQ